MSGETHPGKRICEIVKLRPEFEEEYIKIHANVPEPVLERLRHYHIEDYSIHYYKELGILISHFKYTGEDLAAESKLMRLDPVNHEWWAKTDQMQQTFLESKGSHDENGWWLGLPEVFRFDH